MRHLPSIAAEEAATAVVEVAVVSTSAEAGAFPAVVVVASTAAELVASVGVAAIVGLAAVGSKEAANRLRAAWARSEECRPPGVLEELAAPVAPVLLTQWPSPMVSGTHSAMLMARLAVPAGSEIPDSAMADSVTADGAVVGDIPATALDVGVAAGDGVLVLAGVQHGAMRGIRFGPFTHILIGDTQILTGAAPGGAIPTIIRPATFTRTVTRILETA